MNKLIPLFMGLALSFYALEGHCQEMTLELVPKEDKVFTNHSLTSIHASCKIHTYGHDAKLKVKSVNQSTHFDGRNIDAGKSTTVTVTDQKSIEVSAEPGAEVNIRNLGKDPVEAVCSA